MSFLNADEIISDLEKSVQMKQQQQEQQSVILARDSSLGAAVLQFREKN